MGTNAKRKAAEEIPYIPQVLVTVRRGLTDNTPSLVYPWEVPILEVIHGEGNVVENDHAETEKWLRLTGVNQPKDSEYEMLSGAKKTTEAYDPSMDIAAEYMRMEQKFGRHAEMPQSNVENVYGPLKNGQFEAAVLENLPEELRAGREAKILREGGAEQLSGAQIRSALDARGIKYRRTGNRSTLAALLNNALDLEREQLVGEGN